MLQDKATLSGCGTKKQDRDRSVLGKDRAPPCGCLWKTACFARIPVKGRKKLKSCFKMPGISSAYVSYNKNMWIYYHVSPSSSTLHPDGTRRDRSAGWPPWNLSLLWCSGSEHWKGNITAAIWQTPSNPTNSVIIVLCYIDCEVDKIRHYHCRCTGEKTQGNTHLKTWGRYNTLVFHIPSYTFQTSFYAPDHGSSKKNPNKSEWRCQIFFHLNGKNKKRLGRYKRKDEVHSNTCGGAVQLLKSPYQDSDYCYK